MLEIVMRHNTATKALRPLEAKFFKATKVELSKKMTTASSLLLSRTFVASGGWRSPTVAERPAIRSRVMSVYRAVACERFRKAEANLTSI